MNEKLVRESGLRIYLKLHLNLWVSKTGVVLSINNSPDSVPVWSSYISIRFFPLEVKSLCLTQ